MFEVWSVIGRQSIERYLPVALLVLTLAGCGPGIPSSAPPAPKPDQNQATPTVSKAPEQAIQLVDFTDNETGIKLKVPDGWTKQKVSGGDWSGWDFRNPVDPKQYVEAITSGCVGCMTNQDGVADAREVVPSGATKVDVSPDLSDATYAFTPSSPSYVGFGKISVSPGVEYGRVEVVINPNQESMAKEIIRSFAVTNSNFMAARTNSSKTQTNIAQLDIPMPTLDDIWKSYGNPYTKTPANPDKPLIFAEFGSFFNIYFHLNQGEMIWTYVNQVYNPRLQGYSVIPAAQAVVNEQNQVVCFWDAHSSGQQIIDLFPPSLRDNISSPEKITKRPDPLRTGELLQWRIPGGEVYFDTFVLKNFGDNWRQGIINCVIYVDSKAANRISIQQK